VAGTVRDLVARHLASGHVTMAWASKQLGMSVSTLRRHLDGENTTFRDIVDAVRREIAERQLSRGLAGVSELAFVLGFSSVSAFHRAFKRWRGEAPTEFRDRMRRG
jgi:AraC-like DNA-binding protein